MSGTEGSERQSGPTHWEAVGSVHAGRLSAERCSGTDRMVPTFQHFTPAVAVGGLLLCFSGLGCRTDQAAQDGINQMRAEQIAIEDRYAALRNEYEKLRNRLAAQGDAAAQNPEHPSALPLTYPPGAVPLDGVPGGDPAWAWPNDDFPNLQRQPLEAPVPALRPGGSVLEGPPAGPPAKPARVELDAGQTRVMRGADGQQVTLRMVARTTDGAGRAANPNGTYSLRLRETTAGGNGQVIGDWNFPAESIRRFVAANGGSQGRAAEAGVPLEVSFVDIGGQATQWLAELEYFPSQGQKLSCREWVGENVAGPPSLQSWVDQLPVPRDGRGLMSTGTGSVGRELTNEGSKMDGPAWSPRRD